MKRIAVLVSGGGTNLQAILESERRGENPNGQVVLVVASKPGVYALTRAENFGVKTAVVPRKTLRRARILTRRCLMFCVKTRSTLWCWPAF